MKQTNKRVLSLLMALTMLIGLMSAVTVSAATTGWEVVGNVIDFETMKEGATTSSIVYSGGTGNEILCVNDGGSKAIKTYGLGGNANNMFRTTTYEYYSLTEGETYRISARVKAVRQDSTSRGVQIYWNGQPQLFQTLTGTDAQRWNTWKYHLPTEWTTCTWEYIVPAGGGGSGRIMFTYDPDNTFTNEAEELAKNVVWIDDIKVEKLVTYEAPVVVGDVAIEGLAHIGQTLTATAVVTDANEGDIATPSYQWQVKIGDDWKDISSATSNTYEINEKVTVDGTEIDILGKQVRVMVTPLSNNPNDPAGTPVYSEEVPEIFAPIVPPSGREPKIEGDFKANHTLTASFTYVPSESNIPKGEAEYIWEISSDNQSFTSVQSGTNNNYTIRPIDIGKWLRVRIIPKDKYGFSGEELTASASKIDAEVTYYVSSEGSDANDGSLENPFRTIQKARDTIRALEGYRPVGGITVNIMGGTYDVSETIAFTEEDSGTEESPIVYQAYNNETVTFTGGMTLDSSKIEKVTDEDVLDRLVEEEAKKHLYMLDLSEQGVEMDALQPYGDGYNRDTTKYRPKRIYMNNQLLTDARWPNDDQSQNLVTATPVTKEQNADVAAGNYNAEKTPIMYHYPDPENRSEKWDVKEGDAYVGGAIVYFWAPAFLRIKDIDTEKKIVTSMDNSNYGTVTENGSAGEFKIFFSNIFAEIDKPGESYVDRENNILYFYPIGSIDNADMVVSTLKKNMISLSRVSNVTFKGIDFKNTVETAVVLKDCDNVTIAGAEIANITQRGVEMTNCTDTVIEGCNIYTIGESAIKIIGDNAVELASTPAEKLETIPENRKTLTPSGNEIRYNNFHNTNVFPNYRNTAVDIHHAVGEWIHHNEFNDIDIYTIRMVDSNNTLIEYNKFLNLGELNSDAGAINWGREIDSLGHTVRYNYFENIGSKLVANHLDGHQSVSVFVDDASTGGEIYGNVFLNGGSNQNGAGSPTVGNGPEFSNVWGNISICTDFDRMQYTFRMRNKGDTEGLTNTYGATIQKGTAASTWLYHMGMRTPYGSTNSSAMHQAAMDMMWSEEWAEYYADTQWAAALKHYSKENYNGAKVLFAAGDYKGVLEFLSENLVNERTNKIHNNVSLGAIQEHTETRGIFDDNYYGTQHAITEEDKALFVDFDNKDFTLTDAGLAKIQAKAPEFEAIPFNEIGLGNKAVGGHKPVVTVKQEVYTATADGFGISPSYTFADADGDSEGTTKIYWHVSDTADGKYEQIYGGVEGNYFEVTEEYLGKYLKYEVVPFDTTSLRGEPVWSDPISVSTVTITANVGQNGKLMKNEKAVLATEEVLASGTYTYKVVPDSGYEVETVVVVSGENTISPTLNADNEFEVTVSEDTTITVIFRENPVPTIVTESTVLPATVTDGETEYQAYLAFATITNVDKITDYGMYLNFPGGQIKLEGLTDEDTMKMMVECNGKFAFRVFGEALKGKTITLVPYITADGEESIGAETEELTYQ